MRSPGLWRLEGFLERFDRWQEMESPSKDLGFVVLEWIHGRSVDPRQGLKRESDIPNLWFGVVPDSHDARGCVVVCSCVIDEENRVVRCDQLSSLMPPI